MASENKTITDLDSLTNTTLTDNDLVLITDISANETKNISVSEFVQYNITSSGILSNLVSGSFTGSFSGSLIGIAQSASYSSSSLLSSTSSYLFYNGQYNGTASYSLSSSVADYSETSSFSISASYSLSSSYSITSSKVETSNKKHSYSSSFANYSENTVVANTSSYIYYNGQNNGTIYRSITTERSNHAITASNLELDNRTIIARSITSSYSLNSLSSSFIVSSSICDFSISSSNPPKTLFCYIKFRCEVGTGTDAKVTLVPERWFNVKKIGLGPNPIKNFGDSYWIEFPIKYKDVPFLNDENINKSLLKSTIVTNLQLGNIKEIQQSVNSGKEKTSNVNVGKIPYRYLVSGYSCGMDGFIIRLTVIQYYSNDNQYLSPLQSGVGTKILTNLLQGSVLSAMVYINENGIDFNDPNVKPGGIFVF